MCAKRKLRNTYNNTDTDYKRIIRHITFITNKETKQLSKKFFMKRR